MITFFTSSQLLADLSISDVKAVGTVRQNRTTAAAKAMKAKSVMKKSDRGIYDYHSEGKIFFCIWNDNSIVNIRSNFLTDEPVQSVKRTVKQKSDVDVAQSFLVKEYNSMMGGFDVMDWLLGSYHQIVQP